MLVCEIQKQRKPTRMSESQPIIDMSCIELPSDRISLGLLRKLYPDQFFDKRHAAPNSWDSYCESSYFTQNSRIPGSGFEEFGSLHLNEEAVARYVFERTLAGDRNVTFINSNVLEEVADVEFLVEEYQKLGLASGQASAIELLKSIEAQAIQQAKQHIKGHF